MAQEAIYRQSKRSVNVDGLQSEMMGARKCQIKICRLLNADEGTGRLLNDFIAGGSLSLVSHDLQHQLPMRLVYIKTISLAYRRLCRDQNN